jgi:hypothetical protein
MIMVKKKKLVNLFPEGKTQLQPYDIQVQLKLNITWEKHLTE